MTRDGGYVTGGSALSQALELSWKLPAAWTVVAWKDGERQSDPEGALSQTSRKLKKTGGSSHPRLTRVRAAPKEL